MLEHDVSGQLGSPTPGLTWHIVYSPADLEAHCTMRCGLKWSDSGIRIPVSTGHKQITQNNSPNHTLGIIWPNFLLDIWACEWHRCDRLTINAWAPSQIAQAVALDFILKCSTANSQFLGRLSSIRRDVHESLADQFCLHLGQRHSGSDGESSVRSSRRYERRR